ncbi:MAG: hypothetical protein ACFFDY_00945 [Candidatus Thorarchaeota archaeon]
MAKNNIRNSDMEFKIESELFALIKSINNLNNKYQKGIVNENFFRKTLRNAMNNFLKLNFTLKENNLHLPDIVNRMDLSQEYNAVLDLINRVSTLNITDTESSLRSKSFLELPGITSEITSSFITLMDALTLEGMTKKELIFNLFDELNSNLGNFPGLDDLLDKVKSLHKYTTNHIDRIESDDKLRENLIDELYQIFKEFQNKLNLKS